MLSDQETQNAGQRAAPDKEPTGHISPGMSIWLRLTPELPNCWSYLPAMTADEATPAELVGLKARGWVEVDVKQAPYDLLILAGQFAPVGCVFIPPDNTVILAKQEDVKRTKQHQVLLAFPLAEEMLATLPSDTITLPIILRLPPPAIGQIALINTENGWLPYSLSVTGKRGLALWQQLSEALLEHVKPADWWPYPPYGAWETCATPEDYEEVRTAIKQEFKQAPAANQGDLRRLSHLLEQTKKQRDRYEQMQARLAKQESALDDPLEEIRQTATQLSELYWKAHQNMLQVERPKPINIWTLKDGEAAWALLTMVQAGVHASVNNKDKWEKRAHMIQAGKYQGLEVGRYVHTSGKKGENEYEYWMQPPEDTDTPIDPELVSQEVLRQQAKLDDLEQDLSNLAPVYLLASGEEEAYISPEQIAKDLGYAIHLNQAGYGNTHEPDEIRRIRDAFERLAWLRIKTSQSIQKRKGRKPALITVEAPYLIITEWKWQESLEGFGPRQFLGWKYQITWLEKFTGNTEAGKQLGILLKKSFAYSGKQRWEKRLARYFTIHLNVAAHHGQESISRIIRDVLEQCGLAPTERDRRLPGEYAKKFETAMGNLKRDGIIGDWMPKLDRHDKDFPARDWLDLWLDSSFHATQAPSALEAGYQKMIEVRKPHKPLEGA